MYSIRFIFRYIKRFIFDNIGKSIFLLTIVIASYYAINYEFKYIDYDVLSETVIGNDTLCLYKKGGSSYHVINKSEVVNDKVTNIGDVSGILFTLLLVYIILSVLGYLYLLLSNDQYSDLNVYDLRGIYYDCIYDDVRKITDHDCVYYVYRNKKVLIKAKEKDIYYKIQIINGYKDMVKEPLLFEDFKGTTKDIRNKKLKNLGIL